MDQTKQPEDLLEVLQWKKPNDEPVQAATREPPPQQVVLPPCGEDVHTEPGTEEDTGGHLESSSSTSSHLNDGEESITHLTNDDDGQSSTHLPGAYRILGPDAPPSAAIADDDIDSTPLEEDHPSPARDEELADTNPVIETEAHLVDEDAERDRFQQQIISEAPRADVVDEVLRKRLIRRRRLLVSVLLIVVVGLVLGLVLGIGSSRFFNALVVASGDECADAFFVDDLPYAYTGSTESATVVHREALDCNTVESQDRGQWFLIQGTGSCMMASVTASDFDTVLGVYEGVCGDLNCLHTDKGIQESDVFWKSSLRTYYLLVGGSGGSDGEYQLDISEYDCLENDNCTDATAVRSFPFEDSGSTLFATAETSAVRQCSSMLIETRGVFYEVEGTGSCFTASTAGSDFDTSLAIYEGSCSELSCLTQEIDKSRSPNSTSTLSWRSKSGIKYKLFVAGHKDAVGRYNLTIKENDCDSCVGAITVGELPFADSGSTDFASTAESEALQPACPSIQSGDRGVWYTLKSGSNCITASTGRSDFEFDTVLTVYQGRDCEELSCVGQNDDKTSCHESCRTSIFTWNPPSAGMVYKVFLSGKSQQTGSFGLDITENECDRCHKAILIQELPFFDVGDNEFAGGVEDIGLECWVIRTEDRGVWYKLDNLGTGSCITASTKGSEIDTVLAVYEVEDHLRGCDTLRCLNANNNLPPAPDRDENETLKSEVFWRGEVGSERFPKDYFLFVGGRSGVTGKYDLTVMEYECLENDDCGGAASVEGLPYFYSGTTINATSDHSSGAHECSLVEDGTRGAWHELVGTGSCLSAALGSNFNDLLAVYEGACGELACIVQDSNRIKDVKSKVTWMSQTGTIYRVFVAGFEDIVGDYNLTIQECVDKDECLVAVEVESLPYSTTDNLNGSVVATADFRLANMCWDFNLLGTFGRGFWYELVGTGSCITVSTERSDIDTVVGIYEGDCEKGLRCVAYNDDRPEDWSSEVTWRSNTESIYFVLVAGLDNEVGPFELHIEERSCIPNDECTEAKTIDGLPYFDSSTTLEAAVDGGSASACLVIPAVVSDLLGEGGPLLYETRGVWYQVDGAVAPCFNASVVGHLPSDDRVFDAWLAVYDGEDCDTLSCVNVSKSVAGWHSTGAQYKILVMGHHGGVGNFNLTVDDC